MSKEKEDKKEELEQLKNSLTIEQINDLVADLGAEPRLEENKIVLQTICHNHPGQGSHKLYYYDNTKLFKCYTDCGDTFDIFTLIQRYMNNLGETKPYYTKEGNLEGRPWEVFDAIEFVQVYFNISTKNENFEEKQQNHQDMVYLNNLISSDFKMDNKKQIVELKIYDEKILKYLPHPRIPLWENEGISREVMENRGICFDPKNYGIVIPHYDINNNLIGIRERTLVKEEEKNGKYKPAILNGKMYNHPLGFNLYNINNSKDNIKLFQKAIVWEGEKSPLLYASYFGEENDITVSTCGFNLLDYQVELLLSCGAKEIVIAFDKQFQEKGDKEWERLISKLYKIHEKYGLYTQISYIYDKNNLLDYKMSPIDAGPNTFLKLFQERIII